MGNFYHGAARCSGKKFWSAFFTQLFQQFCAYLRLHWANHWASLERSLKRVSCHGNRIFIAVAVFSVELISPPNFNDLCCKLANIALFIYLIYKMGWMYDAISHLICIFFKLKGEGHSKKRIFLSSPIKSLY